MSRVVDFLSALEDLGPGLEKATKSLFENEVKLFELEENRRKDRLDFQQKRLQIEKLKNDLSPEQVEFEKSRLQSDQKYKDAQTKQLTDKILRDKRADEQKIEQEERVAQDIFTYKTGVKTPPQGGSVSVTDPKTGMKWDFKGKPYTEKTIPLTRVEQIKTLDQIREGINEGRDPVSLIEGAMKHLSDHNNLTDANIRSILGIMNEANYDSYGPPDPSTGEGLPIAEKDRERIKIFYRRLQNVALTQAQQEKKQADFQINSLFQ